jgi:uncharacterized protein (DUF1330 family)
MSKGYWIVSVNITDPEAYKLYVAANKAALDRFGGRFLARGGRHDVREGTGRARNVIVEFESYEQAVACYESPEYQAAVKLRVAASTAGFIIVEGVAL